MNIDIKFLEDELVGTMVPKPLSGTLSGHAAGEPFDKCVYQFIKEHYGEKAFRQYEFLNKLYSDNPEAVSVSERHSLVAPTLAFLLNRGKEVTKKWGVTNLFVEKQDDTADILVIEDGFFNLVDVKTRNSAIAGPPPNIISSYKLAKMCASMLETGDFASHDITYVGVMWRAEEEVLVCIQASIKELFKAEPSDLYINWAAAMQIQFHVEDLNQSYSGTVGQWCRDYLRSFVEQAQGRADKMLQKFVYPFKKFL